MCRGLLWSALAVWLLLFAGCTLHPVEPPADESLWLAHQASVSGLQKWQVSGRVAIHQEQEGWHANFDWLQRGETYRIRLRGPFGQGAVELHGSSEGVWLKQPGQLPRQAQDAETLLAAETGWRLPVNGLSYWLTGLPEPHTPVTGLDWDADGRLEELDQASWEIEYRRYTQAGGVTLPDRLSLHREALRVKVVIDRWTLP